MNKGGKGGKAPDQEVLFLEHLEKFKDLKMDGEVPVGVTQEGIAKATGIPKSKISPLGKKLEESGRITSKIMKIKKLDKRKKAYFLTQETKSSARDAEVEYVEKAPEIKNFFGREAELDVFKGWLESEEQRFLIISGIAGMGKTTFMTKAIQPITEKIPIFKYWFNDWTTIRDTLTKLGAFLSDSGKEGLSGNLRSKETTDINEIGMILTEELEGFEAIFIFDDYQRVIGNKNITHMLGMFKKMLEDVKGPKVIIMGRELQRSFYDERDISIKNLVLEMKLGGLDKASSLELLETREISGKLATRLYSMTKGHPLWLELVHTTGADFDTQKGIKRFIFDEIISHLTSEEKLILDIASVFRYPVDPSAYLEIAGAEYVDDDGTSMPIGLLAVSPDDENEKQDRFSYDVIDSLINKSLFQTLENGCDVQNMIREFAYDRIPKRQRLIYHDKVAKYYLENVKGRPRVMLEAQHHLLIGGNHREVANHIIESFEELLRAGLWRELRDIVDKLKIDTIDREARPDLVFVRGRLYELQGKNDKALEYYKSSIKHYGNIDNNNGMANAYSHIGMVYRKKALTSDSLLNYQKSLKLYAKEENLHGMGEVCEKMGATYALIGEYKDGVEAFSKALDYLKKAKDVEGIALAHADLAFLMHNLRRFDEAIKYSKMALNTFTELGDKHQLARVHMNIGAHYNEKGNFKEGTKWLKKSIIIAKDASELWMMPMALTNLAESYSLGGETGDLRTALIYCNKAESMAEKLYDTRGLIFINRIYGVIHAKMGDMVNSEKFFNKAIEISKKQRMPEDVAQVHLWYGRMLAENDEIDKAKQEFKEVVKICLEAKNFKMAETAKEELKSL